MATITRQSTLGNGMELIFNYDDVSMKLISIQISNLSNKSLFLDVTSPVSFSRTWDAGIVTTYNIPAGQRPTWYSEMIHDDVNNIDIQKIRGIDWRICPL